MLVEGFDDGIEFTAQDAASVLLGEVNFDLQLTAIRDLLALTHKADGELAARMKEIERLASSATGEVFPGYSLNDHYVDLWGEHFYASVYQDAAHSMAAVGALAPLIESLFSWGFKRVGEELFGDSSSLPKSARADGTASLFWDCHYFYAKGSWHKQGLVDGILQVAVACGLAPFLPDNTKQVLDALFAYRNQMFHCGFEWPTDERRKFANRIGKDWPESWFSKAESGGHPWIFYMTHDFIDLLLLRTGEWIEAFGKLYLEKRPLGAAEDES